MTSHGCKEPHLGIWPRPAPQHPAAATLHYRSSRFAWRLPGGQLHSPDEMRRLNVWDLSAQAAISTISYYIPPSFPAPLFLCSTLPSHRLPHSLLYIDEVVMGPLVRYSCCKNIVLFLVSLRGQCILLELLGRISALLMMQFQCNSDLLKSQHSTPPPFFFFLQGVDRRRCVLSCSFTTKWCLHIMGKLSGCHLFQFILKTRTEKSPFSLPHLTSSSSWEELDRA